MVRPQYHFRESENGLLAWDVRRLIKLTSELAMKNIKIAEIAELDENHWYTHEVPSCRSIIEHCDLIQNADLSHPIILDPKGRVMDGMHRVCQAAMKGVAELPAVQFESDPEPDYVGRDPDSLPYDD